MELKIGKKTIDVDVSGGHPYEKKFGNVWLDIRRDMGKWRAKFSVDKNPWLTEIGRHDGLQEAIDQALAGFTRKVRASRRYQAGESGRLEKQLADGIADLKRQIEQKKARFKKSIASAKKRAPKEDAIYAKALDAFR